MNPAELTVKVKQILKLKPWSAQTEFRERLLSHCPASSLRKETIKML